MNVHRTVSRIFSLLFVAYLSTWANACSVFPLPATGIRFTPPILNYLFFIAAQVIPLLMIITVPGLLVIEHPLTGGYPAHEAAARAISNDTVRIDVSGKPDFSVDAKLRRWPGVLNWP